jgi:hypothetical protein
MARRGGKAATRRSRQQRRAQRPSAQPTQSAQSQPAAEPEGTELAEDQANAAKAEPVDAFEAADAELRASTPPPGTRADARRSPNRSVRARTSDFNLAGGSSRLSERAAAEYHYVGRDLRNIGILLVVMVVLLAISAVVVNLLGIGA